MNKNKKGGDKEREKEKREERARVESERREKREKRREKKKRERLTSALRALSRTCAHPTSFNKAFITNTNIKKMN